VLLAGGVCAHHGGVDALLLCFGMVGKHRESIVELLVCLRRRPWVPLPSLVAPVCASHPPTDIQTHHTFPSLTFLLPRFAWLCSTLVEAFRIWRVLLLGPYFFFILSACG
jgi:hypothetical protein